MGLLLRAGERVPVDCRNVEGRSDVDLSIVTVESMAVAVKSGTSLAAGAMDLSVVLQVEAKRPASESFLSQIAMLMETAEASRTEHRRIADRAASIYAPAVHAAALLPLLGWGLLAGNWHAAMLNAVALSVAAPAARLVVEGVREIARQGIEARADGVVWRLGSAPFCGGADTHDEHRGAGTEVCLGRDGEIVSASPMPSGRMWPAPWPN